MYWKNQDIARSMSGLSNLNKRLQYHGGHTEGRMEKDKLIGLKKALYNSYQAETAILEDQREFKCLINPDKLHTDYDNKIISIPFKDKCLNPQLSTASKDSLGEETIGLKSGDTFTWKETNTHWLIYLRYLEESAYFRAEIRKCEQQLQINDKRYWVYVRGPVETTTPWRQKAGVTWNEMNYSLVLFITRDENTIDFFHRFTKIKLLEPGTNVEKTWKVANKNLYYGDGIIQVFLDEAFENSIEEAAKDENDIVPNPPIDKTLPYIDGITEVKKYDTVVYTAMNFKDNGFWYLMQNGQEQKLKEASKTLTLDVTKSHGSYIVKYKTTQEEAELEVTIQAF